jgi:DNA-binding transcriptional MerR regulator
MDEMMAITEVAKMLGLSPRTIERWEETGKVKKAKRDQRGWRVYDRGDAERLMAFHIAHHFHEI